MSDEVEYDGFVTPSLILEGSEKGNKGKIIDQYAKTEDQDGLICGNWARGFEDGLIHLWLIKPVSAICDEREGWVHKKILLKEPFKYTDFPEEIRTGTVKAKQQPLINTETGVIKW